MTVSRCGKRGKIKMRPASRNNRVAVNGRLNAIRRGRDERPTSNPTSKEQWVISCVARIVGTKAGAGFVMADDVASDIILALLDAGGFNWEEDEIVSFCRRKAAFMVVKYLGAKERSECEFVSADGRRLDICDWAASVPAMQEVVIDAGFYGRCLKAIPNRHRKAMEIICDGGNPINVAEELGVTPWAAITLIKEEREFVNRVDPV